MFAFLLKNIDVSKPLSDQLKKQGLSLAVELPKVTPIIMADIVGLREILRNLVTNAGNHTPAGGHVTIAVTISKSDLRTTVTDTGSGIPKAAVGRLFNKFYRVNEFKATSRGTGLGLYICRSIVEAHGGHIWVESREGKGSTFGFDLPLATIALNPKTSDNKPSITRGTHGWIKNHTVR